MKREITVHIFMLPILLYSRVARSSTRWTKNAKLHTKIRK